MLQLKTHYLRQSKDLKLHLVFDKKKLLLEGPMGSFFYPLNSSIFYEKKEKRLFMSTSSFTNEKKSLSNLFHKILLQASLGVLVGYRRQLNIVGIGYQASVETMRDYSFLNLKLGFSHSVRLKIPDYVDVKCPKPRIIILKGINIQKINNFAAFIRKLRVPSVYKEKGIYFLGESSVLKQGKKT